VANGQSFRTSDLHQSYNWFRRGRDRMVVGYTATYMQAVPIATNVVRSNPDQSRCTRYNNEMKFVSDLPHVMGCIYIFSIYVAINYSISYYHTI
jgi:hypothetical protein